eukprot:GHRR01037596.1.p1 GENE.GHRR01037596.1~~GHRR01037596.1.p1  ORF type:complete len:149 (-),score=24.95 GHRR01037596.1:328-774(-)
MLRFALGKNVTYMSGACVNYAVEPRCTGCSMLAQRSNMLLAIPYVMQLLFNLLELGMDPQAALDTPRFCIDGLDSAIGPTSALESYVLLEEGSNQESAEQLSAKGHNVSTVSGFGRAIFGKGQIILRTEDGVLCGGSDPRGDGAVLAW